MFGTNPNVGVINPIGKGPGPMAKQPSMAIGGVGAAGKGMGIGGMGISGAPPTQAMPSKGADRGGKSRLVQQ